MLFPLAHPFITLFRNFDQSMYEPIKIFDNKALNIVNYFTGKFTCDSLMPIQEKILCVLDLVLQQMSLLFIINILNFFQER